MKLTENQIFELAKMTTQEWKNEGCPVKKGIHWSCKELGCEFFLDGEDCTDLAVYRAKLYKIREILK